MNRQNYLLAVVLSAGLSLTSLVNSKPSHSDISRTGNILTSNGIHEKVKANFYTFERYSLTLIFGF